MTRRKRKAYAGISSFDPFPWLVAAAGGVLILFRQKISDTVVSAMRTPQSILKAVDDVDPATRIDLQPGYWPEPPGFKAGTSWCSKAVAEITALLGAPIPFGQYGTLANAQIAWLAAGNDGWYQVEDAVSAQNAALRGEVAIATYSNPGGHGHIAIVLPIEGPVQIAQAGAANFNRGLLTRGFGNIRPVFFVHA